MQKNLIIFLCLFTFNYIAQFAPAAGQSGTSAIYKDSSIIVSWATSCKLARGWQDISNTNMGRTSVGDSSSAIGHADGINVVSLGDGGSAILSFQVPIKDGSGPDFCVFENSFNNGFLELAFVEVSSDGINFFRFPATSNTPTLTQIGPFDTNGDARKLNNLAGKYVANYGTPFDLQELQGIFGLNVNNITHVKIIDVVGNISSPYATYDQNNNAVNDPWPTAFASGGFDLDAVGVINQQPVGIKENFSDLNFLQIWPTPFTDKIFINSGNEQISNLLIVNQTGKIILNIAPSGFLININTNNFLPGIYYLIAEITGTNKRVTKKIIKI